MDRHLSAFPLLALAFVLLTAVPSAADHDGEDGVFARVDATPGGTESEIFSSRLVFADDWLLEVYLMDVPGYTALQLTDDEPRASGLSWSPFGSRIAYLANGAIWVMGTDGSDRYQLTDSTDRDFSMAWSPDASQIVFSRSPGDCHMEQSLCGSEVWVIDADGSNAHQLAGTESVHAWSPAWSPDGSRIAFTRGDIDCWADCDLDVWVMDANGSNQRNLGIPGRSDSQAVWSPDGSQIAFTSQSSAGVDDIFVMDANGSNQVNLTPDVDHQFFPAWSPDGSMIAFEEIDVDLGCVVCGSDLGVMNSDGTGQTRITNDNEIISGPTWTPDGSWISFWSKRGTGTDVWLIRPGGNDLTQVTTYGGVYFFAWEPVDLGRFGDARQGHLFHDDIEWLATQAITKGCNPPANTIFCSDDYVTRGQMAAFLVRALGYSNDGGGNLFTDDDNSIFEADIDRLAAAGVTRGCNPPDNTMFCPTANVTRGQMAAFLHRALGT